MTCRNTITTEFGQAHRHTRTQNVFLFFVTTINVSVYCEQIHNHFCVQILLSFFPFLFSFLVGWGWGAILYVTITVTLATVCSVYMHDHLCRKNELYFLYLLQYIC